MIRNNLLGAARNARNFAVHHRRRILPYGAIFVFLTTLWFVWDGREESITTTIRETKNEQGSSPPVFLHTSDAASPDKGGTLVVSTSSAVRQRPLPDLFDRPLPKKEAVPQAAISTLPTQPALTKKEDVSPPEPLSWPVVTGTIQSDTKRLVILRQGEVTKVCAPGESIDGVYVAYIHEWAVGLRQGEHTIEIPL